MPDEIFEENLLEDESSYEDDLSSDEGTSLDDKLDHIEALLNENISLMEASEVENDAAPVGEESEAELTTGSGAVEPNYTQYIYDLLLDSQVKVESVQSTDSIFNKPLNDYTVTEGLLLIILSILIVRMLGEFIEKYVFKRR